MLLQEYEGKVFDVSVAMDRLTAVVELLNEHYFDMKLGDDPASRAWWNASHDNIQDVVGAIFAAVCDIKNDLDSLGAIHIRREEAHA